MMVKNNRSAWRERNMTKINRMMMKSMTMKSVNRWEDADLWGFVWYISAVFVLTDEVRVVHYAPGTWSRRSSDNNSTCDNRLRISTPQLNHWNVVLWIRQQTYRLYRLHFIQNIWCTGPGGLECASHWIPCPQLPIESLKKKLNAFLFASSH